MYSRSKILAVFLLLLVPLGLFTMPLVREQITTVPTVTFVLSAFPTADEYDQGIDRVFALVGGVSNQTMYNFNGDYNSTLYMNTDDNVTLIVYVWMNASLTGAITPDEMKNCVRLSISVMSTNSIVVFSQQNFTYQSPMAGIGDMINIHYQVDLDFVPSIGDIYTAIITYEVFY